MFNFKFWGPNIAVGLLFGVGGSFVLFGAPPEVAEPLQRVNLWLGQAVCPSGEQKMFYPGESRVDLCVPKELLVDLPCPPGNEQITVVEPKEIEGMMTSVQDTQCIPKGLNLPKAIRQPLIPSPKPRF